MNNYKTGLPPQNIEFEESVICGCLLFSEICEDVTDVLTPEDFYRTAHQKIYKAILDLKFERSPIDLLTVTEKLRFLKMLEEIGGAFYLAKILDESPVPIDTQYVIKKIRECSELRKTIEICNKITRSCYDFIEEPEEIIDQFQTKALNIDINTKSESYVGLKQLVLDGDDRHKLVYENTSAITGVGSGFKDIDTTTCGFQKGDLIILAARPSMGKCLGEGTKIVMYSGDIKRVETIKSGDLLMGMNSRPRRVLSTNTGKEMMYNVKPYRGTTYRANGSHILSLKRSKNEGNAKHGEIKNISINDILFNRGNSFLAKWKGYKTSIEFKEKEVPIEPYFLGLWLGDGHSYSSRITNIDVGVIEYLKTYAKKRNGSLSVLNKTNSGCCDYNIIGGSKRNNIGEANGNAKLTKEDVSGIKEMLKSNQPQKDIAKLYGINRSTVSGINTGKRWGIIEEGIRPIQTELKNMGLLNNKHIPKQYLINSSKVRQELLAGLIDSDGYLNKNGPYEITMKNVCLMEQIKFLCDSLGFSTGSGLKKKATTCQNGVKGIAYRLTLNGDLTDCPIKIKTKKQKKPFTLSRDYTMTGIRIEQDKVDSYYGFEIDGDGLFLLEDMTVTHNSALMRSMSVNMAKQKHPNLIISLEMSKEQIYDTMISSESNINSSKFRNGMFSQEDWGRKADAASSLYELNCFVIDRDCFKLLDICKIARQLKKKENVQAVFIDYLQLIEGDTTKTKNYEIGEITRRLKQLAKELDLPIILLSQLNRKCDERTDKRPILSDLRDSGSIEQDADIIIFLYRHEEYIKNKYDEDGNMTEEMKKWKGIAEVNIAKQRMGPTRIIDLVWLKKTVTFKTKQRS